MAPQLAEELFKGCKKCQGMAPQLAEELFKGCKKCQGTTLVVPQVLQN